MYYIIIYLFSHPYFMKIKYTLFKVNETKTNFYC